MVVVKQQKKDLGWLRGHTAHESPQQVTHHAGRAYVCGSFIEIKGVGEVREKEEEEKEARISLPIQKSGGKRKQEWAELVS